MTPHPVSPLCHSGPSRHSLPSRYARTCQGHPISHTWTCSSFCHELSPLRYLFGSSPHFTQVSAHMPSPQRDVFSPSSSNIPTQTLSLPIYFALFSSKPLSLLDNMHPLVIFFFVICLFTMMEGS